MSQHTPIRLDWCRSEDVARVGELIQHHWRSGHILARDPGLYAWQFRHFQRPCGLSALLAHRGDELVGHLGLAPGDFNLHGRRLPAAWTSMWFVASGAESTGAGVALLRKAQEEAGAVLGCLRYNPSAGRLYQALGFRLWPATPRWVRLGQNAPMRSLLAGSPQPYPSELIHRLEMATQNTLDAPAGDLEVVEWPAVGPTVWDQAWRNNLASVTCGAWLDAQFITWRYLEHPVFAYKARLARRVENGSVVGLMVYRVQDIAGRPERVLRILELLGGGQAIRALLHDLLTRALEPETAFVDFHSTSRQLVPGLTEAGFVLEEGLPDLLPSHFQPLDFRGEPLPGALWAAPGVMEMDELLADPALCITRGQGDQDRPN